MSKANELYKAKSFLDQALIVANGAMPNNRVVAEARYHIKQAMTKLESVAKVELGKKQMTNSAQFEKWWGNVQAGTASASFTQMTPEAKNRTLSALNAMIAEEKSKLDDLEKQPEATMPQPTAQELLEG